MHRINTLILIGLCGSMLWGAPAAMAPEAIVEQYCSVARDHEHSLDGASMEVEIEASLPKLQKRGRLQALRRISALGRITYERLRFEGDGAVKNDVIARYLTAESQAQNDSSLKLNVTPENYKFKYKGLIQAGGREAHVFEVAPKKKRVGLYRGELWIDAETFLRVRESGSWVKNPSIFLKKVEFVRKFEIRNGISVPLEVHSVVDTRLIGKAELNIEFHNVELGGNNTRAGLVEVDGQ